MNCGCSTSTTAASRSDRCWPTTKGCWAGGRPGAAARITLRRHQRSRSRQDDGVNKPAGTKQVAAAAGALAVLEGQAETVRAELSRLRQELAQVEHDFSARRGAELLEANEQLVLAAMRAQEIADRARSNLDALVTSGTNAVLAPIPPRSGPAAAESGRDEQDLLEANEHLVLAALTSKEREATAQAAY